MVTVKHCYCLSVKKNVSELARDMHGEKEEFCDGTVTKIHSTASQQMNDK